MSVYDDYSNELEAAGAEIRRLQAIISNGNQKAATARDFFIERAAIAAMAAIIAKTDFTEYPENGPVDRDVYTARGAVHYATALYDAIQKERSK